MQALDPTNDFLCDFLCFELGESFLLFDILIQLFSFRFFHDDILMSFSLETLFEAREVRMIK